MHILKIKKCAQLKKKYTSTNHTRIEKKKNSLSYTVFFKKLRKILKLMRKVRRINEKNYEIIEKKYNN
jgi:hypothetical protein